MDSPSFLGENSEKKIDTVVLFAKAQSSQKKPDERYRDAVKKLGIEAYFFSPIDFEFCYIEELSEKMRNSDQYDGVVFTSVRCVDAFKLAMSKCANPEEIQHKWSQLAAFTVGKTTAQHLKECLSIDSCGNESGSGKELANYIVKQNESTKFTKPLLYPCGTSHEEAIVKILQDNNVAIDETLCYTTVASFSLYDDLRQIQEFLTHHQVSIVFVVYFSPSGVTAIGPLLREQISQNTRIFYVAIGATTAKQLELSRQTASFVCEKPTPESLCQGLEKFLVENRPAIEARKQIDKWLNNRMKVKLSDGRTIIGTFVGTDSQKNIILSNSQEFTPETADEDCGRSLHLVMVPGKHILSIHIENPESIKKSTIYY